jgi:hypothetical protein
MLLDYSITVPPVTGGLILKHDGTDLSARWAAVPVTELSAIFKEVAQTIADVGRIGYEFPGSDARLDFLYQDGTVTISATYNSGAIIHVSYLDLLAAIDEFNRRVAAIR